MDDLKTETCSGCGKVHTFRDAYEGGPLAVDLAPGVRVHVCRGRYASEPKKSCYAAALMKAAVCPGCGKPHMKFPGTTCEACDEKIAKVRDSEIDTLHGYVLDKYAFPRTSSNGSENRDTVGAFLKVLAVAVAGPFAAVKENGCSAAVIPTRKQRGYDSGSNWGPWVELLPRQVEALSKLTTLWAAVAEDARAQGRAEGRNLLMSLADGSLAMDDFEKQERDRREAHAKAEAKLAAAIAGLEEDKS